MPRTVPPAVTDSCPSGPLVSSPSELAPRSPRPLGAAPAAGVNALLRGACLALGAPSAFVYLAQSDEVQLHVQRGAGESARARPDAVVRRFLAGLDAWSAQPTAGELPEPLPLPLAAEPEIVVRAYLAHGLFDSSGRGIGCLCVLQAEPRGWTETERELLASLAASAACTLELGSELGAQGPAGSGVRSSRGEAQQMLERMRAVATVAARILGAHTPEALFQVLHDACRRVLRCDRFFLALYDAAQDSFQMLSTDEAGAPPVVLAVPAAGTPAGRVARERRSLVTRHASDAAAQGATQLDAQRPAESAIRTPVLKGDEVLGVISVQSLTPERYGPRDVEVLEAIAALAATALQNIRLLAERAAVTETLRRSEERYRRLFHEDVAGYVVSTPEGRLLACNPALVELFGFGSAEEMLACSTVELYPDERARTELLDELRRHGRLLQREVEMRRRDGSPLYVLENLSGAFDERGELVELRGHVLDITARRQAEEALRLSEEQHRALFEQVPIGVFHYDRHLRITHCNQQFVRMANRPYDELIGFDIHTLPDPRVLPAFAPALQGELSSYEGPYRTPSGQDWWISLRCSPLRDGEGRVVGGVGVVENVTEQRRAEQALRDQALLLDTLADAVLVMDREGRVTECNPAAERIFGYERAEMIGRAVVVFHDPDVRPWLEERIREHLRREGRWRGEIPIVRKDGVSRVIEAVVVVHRNAQGEIASIVGVNRDVTERKEVERERAFLLQREQLARTEAEKAERKARFLAEASELFATSLDYEATLRSLTYLVIPRLADSCITYLLDELGEVARLEPAHVEPLREQQLRERLRQAPARLELLIPPVAHVLRSGQPLVLPEVSGELLRALPDDPAHQSIAETIGLRSLLVVPLRTRGRIIGALSLGAGAHRRAYDADDLVLAEELARRAALAIENARLYQQTQQEVRAREQVLRIVSHDLRNPLSTIVLNASAILDLYPATAPLDPWIREQVEAVMLSAEQMNRLIRDLVDVARIETGGLSVERIPHSVGALMRNVARVFQPLAAEQSIRLETQLAQEPLEAWMDYDRIHQVLSNLIGNALRFTRQGGQIRVRSELCGAEVRFSVSDTGAGIAPEQVKHLFTRDWQVHSTRRGGAGLGLTIAKGIVEAHGGRIWVESVVGQGSTFHFTVPMTP